jgi:hypothetical protein
MEITLKSETADIERYLRIATAILVLFKIALELIQLLNGWLV